MLLKWEYTNKQLNSLWMSIKLKIFVAETDLLLAILIGRLVNRSNLTGNLFPLSPEAHWRYLEAPQYPRALATPCCALGGRLARGVCARPRLAGQWPPSTPRTRPPGGNMADEGICGLRLGVWGWWGEKVGVGSRECDFLSRNTNISKINALLAALL